MVDAAGLKTIASYADGIGPEKRLIVPVGADGSLGTPTDLVRARTPPVCWCTSGPFASTRNSFPRDTADERRPSSSSSATSASTGSSPTSRTWRPRCCDARRRDKGDAFAWHDHGHAVFGISVEPGRCAVMKRLLAMFGEAFEDVPTYQDAVPGEITLRRFWQSRTSSHSRQCPVMKPSVVSRRTSSKSSSASGANLDLRSRGCATTPPARDCHHADQTTHRYRQRAARLCDFCQADRGDEPASSSTSQWARGKTSSTLISRSRAAPRSGRSLLRFGPHPVLVEARMLDRFSRRREVAVGHVDGIVT